MKIVIDISESVIEHIKDGSFGARIKDRVALTDAVMNGRPLPKGHGDLKDVSNLLTVTDYDGENEKTYVLYDEIKHAPTIVEADEESEVQDADSN